jgi:GntR family negative regulator for fad regulon and positive regulator of fabA
MNWDAPLKPAELTENRLIEAILDGHFPIDSTLPAERELAAQLGVTRPTLREALQRLARDGWVEIRHGRPTRVRDFWREGNLGVLGAIAHHKEHTPPDFVPNLLTVRLLLAPSYTKAAIERHPQEIVTLLEGYTDLEDIPMAFAKADWELHQNLTIRSGNPVFTLILNGFRDLYHSMALIYFTKPAARQHSRNFYLDLREAAIAQDVDTAEAVTRTVMHKSLDLWKQAITQP